MRLLPRILALAALICLGQLASARLVHAYCRTTTVPAREEDRCECSHEGAPLFWPETTLEYTFNERGFPRVSDPALRQVFARSFAHWSDVLCDGEPVALSLRAAEQTTREIHEALPTGPNTNAIAHLSEAEWLKRDYSPIAFALTRVSIRRSTGEIFDVDMMFNGGLGPFSVCGEQGCGGTAVDLENVATHEIGHFFGLAHSDVEDSTMFCSADNDDIDKRSLEPDDIAGICSIYGPEAIEERAAALTSRNLPAGCGCRLSSEQRGASPLAALTAASIALLLVRPRRRRR